MDANAAALATRLGAEDALELIEGSPRLPLVIARVHDHEPFTGSDLVGELAKRRGWMVPAYQLPRPTTTSRSSHAGEDRSVAGARRRARRRLPCVDHGSALAQRRPDSAPTHSGHGY